MVGALDDFHVVLNNQNGVASGYQGVEGIEQSLYVVEMQTCCRFVEDKQGGLLLLLSDEIGQFDALVLATGECRRALSHLDISQSDVLQGLQSAHNGFLLVFREELDSLADGHVQDVVNVLALELYIQNVVLEPLAVTSLALQHKVGHELHLNGYHARALTLVAASSVGIKREILAGESHLLR